jgi:hypothetical protein
MVPSIFVKPVSGNSHLICLPTVESYRSMHNPIKPFSLTPCQGIAINTQHKELHICACLFVWSKWIAMRLLRPMNNTCFWVHCYEGRRCPSNKGHAVAWLASRTRWSWDWCLFSVWHDSENLTVVVNTETPRSYEINVALLIAIIYFLWRIARQCQER